MKVTREQIESLIVGEEYFRPGNGTLTICVLKLENDITVLGESNVISIETFNVEDGKKYAREKAINNLWDLEGYHVKRIKAEQLKFLQQKPLTQVKQLYGPDLRTALGGIDPSLIFNQGVGLFNPNPGNYPYNIPVIDKDDNVVLNISSDDFIKVASVVKRFGKTLLKTINQNNPLTTFEESINKIVSKTGSYIDIGIGGFKYKEFSYSGDNPLLLFIEEKDFSRWQLAEIYPWYFSNSNYKIKFIDFFIKVEK